MRVSRSRGSPPRGRGKEFTDYLFVTAFRITPAWAGKRAVRRPSWSASWDHPRVGGEKNVWKRPEKPRAGSPPRWRGKVAFPEVARHGQGITPAWAGKSARQGRGTSAAEDHPRVGGEKIRDFDGCRVNQGSPPRGRGKGIQYNTETGEIRITPAWAGKSPRPGSRCRPWGDHPRVGGEKWAAAAAAVSTRGSPPRGRGKVGEKGIYNGKEGITPAWAGKSRAAHGPQICRRDHPRVGGEKLSTWTASLSRPGSPPHGRGKDPF